MIEQLQEELDEERRLRKSLLRNLENKMNVVYEIENTRLHYEDFPKMKSSDQEPNHILREAEKNDGVWLDPLPYLQQSGK